MSAEPSYCLSVVLDCAVDLCVQHRGDADFRRGVIALAAELALAEIEDKDTARWIISLAVDPAEAILPLNHVTRLAL